MWGQQDASVDKQETSSKSDDPSKFNSWDPMAKGQNQLQKLSSNLHTHLHTMAQEYIHMKINNE